MKAHEVANLLRRQIQDGELAPGEWLREIPLAARLKVGRTNMREALRLLERDGLVEVEKFRGARVTAPTLYQIFDLFEVRAALFGLVVRFACFRASDEALAEIVERVRDLVEHGAELPATQRVQAGIEIGRLMSAHASPEAQQMILASERRARWHLSYAGLADSDTSVGPVDEWRRLGEALSRRDAAAAADIARSIIYFMQGQVTKMLVARGSTIAAPRD